MQSGLLYVDKPVGVTSHDVVARVRRAARSRRVGHAGTLDPFATGLLVVAVGNATRLLQFVNGEPKVYLADILFGNETDTDDSTGSITRSAQIPSQHDVLAALQSLTGELMQVPPEFSAKHVNGKRAYELARAGKQVELKPVAITVFKWEVVHFENATLRARITCKGGTYIRALARDLGRAVGSAAHCLSLRRESSGSANVDNACDFESLAVGAIADGVVSLINPISALQPMERVCLAERELQAMRNGRSVPSVRTNHTHAVFVDVNDTVLGIGEHVEQSGKSFWHPSVVLAPEPSPSPDTLPTLALASPGVLPRSEDAR